MKGPPTGQFSGQVENMTTKYVQEVIPHVKNVHMQTERTLYEQITNMSGLRRICAFTFYYIHASKHFVGKI